MLNAAMGIKMTKMKKIRNDNHEVVMVRAGADGTFYEIGRMERPTRSEALRTANNLQRDFDDDCDPCRTYVYPEGSVIPIAAGLGRPVW